MSNVDGAVLQGVLNDLKRRPTDAATELDYPLSQIMDTLNGQKSLDQEFIKKACEKWPINPRDFAAIYDDAHEGVIVNGSDQSEKSSRVMERAGKPYYEYRDTAMSRVAKFRPEWIKMLCEVRTNDPDHKDVQWNNGHFMHQFTYFVGPVNFYYLDENNKKQVAVMNTGDSMYIRPFVPHTFSTRIDEGGEGYILALTYGNALLGDAQKELSAIGLELGKEFALDFSTREKTVGSLINYFLKNLSLPVDELSKISNLSLEELENQISGKVMLSLDKLSQIAAGLGVNLKDILPIDNRASSVVVTEYSEARSWDYCGYKVKELACTAALPQNKALEVSVDSEEGNGGEEISCGTHQYGYNVGKDSITLAWKNHGKLIEKKLKPGDSFYIKPFVSHTFSGKGKVLVLRIPSSMGKESIEELSYIGQKNVDRVVTEKISWFDPKGRNVL